MPFLPPNQQRQSAEGKKALKAGGTYIKKQKQDKTKAVDKALRNWQF